MGMSIDEAISWLEELTFHEGEDVPIYDTDVEAIKMGIKALKRESVIDKISGAEVLEYIDDVDIAAETIIVADKFHGKHCPVQPTIPPMPKQRLTK